MDAAKLDLLLCPVYPLPALLHGTGADLGADRLGSLAILYNLLGYPAGTVPVTRVRSGEESDRARGRDVTVRKALEVEADSAGLPVGVQVVGRPWREDTVLAAMASIETVRKREPDFPRTPTEPVGRAAKHLPRFG